MAEERMIEVCIISASNLKDVNYISKMETYAVLTFAPYVEYTTQVDSKGGLNPRWDEKLGFIVPESVLQRGEANLKVEIFTLSTLGPKFVSEASIPLSDLSVLFKLNDPIFKRYPLKTNSGDYHGDLHVSFGLGEKVVLQKGEHHTYPIVTKFGPHASGTPTYETQPSYPIPTSKPSHVRFGPPPTTDPFSKRTSHTPPPSTFDTPPPSRPSKPSYVEPPFSSKPEHYEAFPPSYVNPLSPKPLKPLPQPTPPSGFTQQPPYGLPYEGADSISYSPIKSPRAPPKFGTHGVNVPISRIDEPMGYGHGDAPPKFGTPRVNELMGFGSVEQSGYGHGADYPTKFGTSRINVPISKIESEESMKFPSFDQSGYGGATKHGYQQAPTTNLNHLFGSPLGKILLTELSKSMTYDRRY